MITVDWLKDFPESVQQLADFAVSILNADTRVEWTSTIETMRWDAKIVLRQGDFLRTIDYSASDKLSYFLSYVYMVYSSWERYQKEKKHE